MSSGDVERCPECESFDIERVHTTRERDLIEDVMICNNCPAQWEISWGDPIIRNVEPEAGL